MSKGNGFTFGVVSDNNRPKVGGSYTGLTISKHHSEYLAYRAARRLALANHGTGDVFWIVKLDEADYHHGIESRCTGPYDERCAICTAVLEALPDYSDQYDKCTVCSDVNDSETGTVCLMCRFDRGEFDDDNFFGYGAMCAECDGPLYPDNVGRLCKTCAHTTPADRTRQAAELEQAMREISASLTSWRLW